MDDRLLPFWDKEHSNPSDSQCQINFEPLRITPAEFGLT